MNRSNHTIERPNLPLYRYAEADRLADVSRGTSRPWLAGYSYGDREQQVQQPPVTPPPRDESAVSFLDLIEAAAIGQPRQIGFSIGRIHGIVGNCQRILDVPRPPTTLRFKTRGRGILVDRGDTLLEVRRKGTQAWSEVLEPFVAELAGRRRPRLCIRVPGCRQLLRAHADHP